MVGLEHCISCFTAGEWIVRVPIACGRSIGELQIGQNKDALLRWKKRLYTAEKSGRFR